MRSRYQLPLIFTVLLTFVFPTYASVESIERDDPLYMYQTVKGGAWQKDHVDRPSSIRYMPSTTGINKSITVVDDTSENTYNTMLEISEDDFRYQLTLLPLCVKYCLEHSKNPDLIEASPSSDLESLEATSLSPFRQAHHFLHNILGTLDKFLFFKKIMPDDFLAESEWQVLQSLVEIVENSRTSTDTSSHEVVEKYLISAHFVQEMRGLVLDLLREIKPTDYVIGVGNTPQLPMRAFLNLAPFIQYHALPLSGWPGRNKISEPSWLENVITPDALENFDHYLNTHILPGSLKAHRLVFIDMVNYGFAIDFIHKRLQVLNTARGLKTPQIKVISLSSYSPIGDFIFKDALSTLSHNRLASMLDCMDPLGRMVPKAPMRSWDKATPEYTQADIRLDPILYLIDENFKKLNLSS